MLLLLLLLRLLLMLLLLLSPSSSLSETMKVPLLSNIAYKNVQYIIKLCNTKKFMKNFDYFLYCKKYSKFFANYKTLTLNFYQIFFYTVFHDLFVDCYFFIFVA